MRVFALVFVLLLSVSTLTGQTNTAPSSGEAPTRNPSDPSNGPKWDRAPKLIKRVDPQFSEVAREQKISGDVEVYVLIDAEGHVAKAHVVRGVGYGLDEEAVKAVQQYVFRPATKDGSAVPCEIYIMVSFRLKDGPPPAV